MDFAKKQLEKYGWKEGEGVGKDGNKGISTALKPKYKNGKEGMGFDLAEDLVDPWWAKAYNDSLKRIKVNDSFKTDASESDVKVKFNDEKSGDEERPIDRIRKRGIKSNFVKFSKGPTLNNGVLKTEKVSSMESGGSSSGDESSDSESETSKPVKKRKELTDEELFKACGGRTAHKSARFGLQLSGKLSRIAAQEEELYNKMKKQTTETLVHKNSAKKIKASS